MTHRWRGAAGLVAGLLCLGLVLSCSNGDNEPPPPGNGVVTGRVVDNDGVGVDGATAALSLPATRQAGGSTTTNASGFFSLSGVAEGSWVLTLSHPGFNDQVSSIQVLADQTTFVQEMMITVGTSQEINPAVENTVTDRGGGCTIPANAIVNSRGRQATTATVDVTTQIVSDANFVQSFPGSFVGHSSATRQDDGTPIESFGVVTIRLGDGAGGTLQLQNGSSATVVWPIDPDNDPGTPTIPIWYLDPTTGEWIQAGVATRDEANNQYVGTVTHFTPWNLDRPFEPGYKIVRLTAGGGQNVAGQLFVARGNNWEFQRATNANGECRIPVLPGQEFDLFHVTLQGEQLVSHHGAGDIPAANDELVNDIRIGDDDDDDDDDDDGLYVPCATIINQWGQNPRDMDSHLTIPTTPDRSHVYFGDRGALNAAPWALLDTDDTNGFGPEIITVRRCLPGLYRYTKHLFSGTGDIATSGEEVTLILRDGRVFTYTPAANQPAETRYWAVFNLEVSASGVVTVTEVNTYGGAELLLTTIGGRSDFVLPMK